VLCSLDAVILLDEGKGIGDIRGRKEFNSAKICVKTRATFCNRSAGISGSRRERMLGLAGSEALTVGP
jgi:hypothetical protein